MVEKIGASALDKIARKHSKVKKVPFVFTVDGELYFYDGIWPCKVSKSGTKNKLLIKSKKGKLMGVLTKKGKNKWSAIIFRGVKR